MRRLHRTPVTLGLLAVLILSTAAAGPPACPGGGKDQPRTVADILTSAGDTKRALRSAGTITAQNDYDISFRLAEANRAYRGFINDELARLAATGATGPDPNARSAALKQLAAALKGLKDPGVLGIKSEEARKTWAAAITGIDTVIQGIELLGGGN